MLFRSRFVEEYCKFLPLIQTGSLSPGFSIGNQKSIIAPKHSILRQFVGLLSRWEKLGLNLNHIVKGGRCPTLCVFPEFT